MSDAVRKATALREQLHRIPELAGCEVKSCAAIREALRGIPGIRLLPPFLQTDTVAFIDGKAPGRNVTLRADIDALAVTENTGVDFASRHPGKMHACGHDVHSAILYGTALELAARRHEFSGSVRLVFQPGEEGRAMAKELIAAGALQDPAPDFVAALHCKPGLPLRAIGVRAGAMASSCTHFKVTFHGKGGHGSRPHEVHNPITAMVAAVSELQYVANNLISVQRSALISICVVKGGEADNVFPDDCYFSGTLRALDMETAGKLSAAVQEICHGVAAIHHVKCEVEFFSEYAPAVNPESGVTAAVKAAEKSGLALYMMPEASMGAEDFAYFLLNSPDGVLVHLGVGENSPPLHNSSFCPPAEVIESGIKFMTELALFETST